MKRFASLLLALLFIFSITACKKNNSDNNSSLPDNTTSGFISLDIEDDNSKDGRDDTATEDENSNDKKDSSKDSDTSDKDQSNKNNSSDNGLNKPNSSDNSSSNDDTNVNSKGESNTASGNNSSITSNNNSTKPSDTGSNNNSADNSKYNTGDSSDGDGNSNDGTNGGTGNNSGNGSENNSNNSSNNNSGNNSNGFEDDSQNDAKPDNAGTTTEPDSSNSQGGDSDTDNSDNSLEYLNIKCRSVSENGWKTIEIAVNSNKLYIKLSIPTDWEITDDGAIMRKNTEIGVINTKLSDNYVDIYEQTSRDAGSVIFKKSVRKYTSGTNSEFKRVFNISQITESLANNLFITINYSELDAAAASKILNSMTYLGIHRPIPAIKNNSKKLLLLGNSFISSSQIGDFLSDMLKTDNNGYSVETMSIGGAEVKNFADNTELINRIKGGEFAIVFQSCFYTDEKSWGSSNKEGPLKTIIDACNTSNTALAILPAHNESSPVFNRALDKYTDIYCINWKNEIDLLINSGIGDGSPSNLTEADFCVDDYYKHSTPLAGYVGAHMIYRTVFSKIPPAVTSSAPLSMSKINEKLLNYPSSGIIPGQSKINKYLIK